MEVAMVQAVLNQGKDGYNEAVTYGNNKLWRWPKFDRRR